MTTNNEVIELEREIMPVVSVATKVKIQSPKDLNKATETLSLVNRYADTVQEKKETLTKPLNLTLKNIRAMFKPLEERLQTSISHLRDAMSEYQTALMDAEKKIAERTKPGKGNLSFETSVKKIEKIGRVDQVATDIGSVEFVEMKKFEVIDITMLPKEYLLANETAIRIAMRNGVELPGVRYYSVQTPRNYR